MVCTLTSGPDRDIPTALHAVAAQRWASMPGPSDDPNRCALQTESVDEDEDDDDDTDQDKSSVPSDDETASGHLASVLRAERAFLAAAGADMSRFPIDTRLARGPPVLGEVTRL